MQANRMEFGSIFEYKYKLSIIANPAGQDALFILPKKSNFART